MTPEEYLRLEEARPYRSEYFDGAMIAMTDRSYANVVINTNLTTALHSRLRHMPWDFFGGSMRVLIEALPLYTYPDACITRRPCAIIEHSESNATVLDPAVLFEVLAPAGENYGRRAIFQRFQKIAALQEYVLISQEYPHVGHYSRLELEPYNQWFYTAYEGLDAVVPLASPGIELPLSEIYERVEFPPPGTTPSHKHPDHDRIF